MKRMKLLWAVLIAAVTMTAAIPVHADVIYEPYDNDFFREHEKDMVREDHIFEVIAEKGSDVYESPVSSKTVGSVQKGERFLGAVSYRDEQGNTWICLTKFMGTSPFEGWVSADCLWVVYDSSLFHEQYAGSIAAKSGTVTVTPDTKDVYLFPYPGAPEAYNILHPKGNETIQLDYLGVFTEEDGTEWGNVTYYYGNRDVWVRLDHPEKSPEELYPDGLPVYDKRVKPDPSTVLVLQPEDPKNRFSLIIVGVLAGIAVVSTALILFLMKKKKADR